MKDDWHAERSDKWTSYWKDEAHDPSSPYILTKCVEISADVRKELELDVVEEESIKITLDGRHLVTILAFQENFANLLQDFLYVRVFSRELGTFARYTCKKIPFFAKVHSITVNSNCGRRSGVQDALE